MRELDVVVMGSSRPQLIPYTVEAFLKYMVFRGRLNLMLHEDVLIRKESDVTLKWARDSGLFSDIKYHDPNLGVSGSVDYVLREMVKTPFFFILQEDCEFERAVDLDQVLWAMEHDEKINQIWFNRRTTYAVLKNRFERMERRVGGMALSLHHGWVEFAAVNRTDWLRQHWKVKPLKTKFDASTDIGWWTKAVLGSMTKRMNHDHCIDNIGSWVYGPMGDWRYFRHIGDSWKAVWVKGLKNKGKMMGQENPVEYHKEHRAPWLPPLPQRPSTATESGWFPPT